MLHIVLFLLKKSYIFAKTLYIRHYIDIIQNCSRVFHSVTVGAILASQL